MTSREFEKKIFRIISIIKQNDNEVTWNDTIADPDTNHRRQIDITIKTALSLSLVECRLHTARQNVKWIEELYGRKVSLNADKIIGVSSSGFTAEAVIKAKVLNIELREVNEVNYDMVLDWFKLSSIQVQFYEIRQLAFVFYIDSDIAITKSNEEIYDEINKKGYDFISDRLSTLTNYIDSVDPSGQFEINQIDPAPVFFSLFNHQVTHIETICKTLTVRKSLNLINIEAYSEAKKSGEVYIENYLQGSAEVIKSSNSASYQLRMENIDVPENTLLSGLIMISQGSNYELKSIPDQPPVITLNVRNIALTLRNRISSVHSSL